jgi:protein phosphatase
MVFYIMPYKILACGLSDIGLVRHNNEDVWSQLAEEQFFVLADGMGGHQAGEIAAKEAVEHVCTTFRGKFATSDKSLQTARQLIKEAIQETNQIIFQMSFFQPEWRGMGTTLCCVLLHPDGLIWGHVGDSRIYRFRNNQLKQLTHDHSLVRELIDLGQLEEQQAGKFIYKNIITRAIGTEPEVEPSVRTDTLLVDDIILMCSDGLTDMLKHEEIEFILQRTSESDMAKALIIAAKRKGGHDNITVVIVKVQEKYEAFDLS